MTNYFIAVSNGRTGSTHLITSLGRLSDVSCDYELKWAPNYKQQDVHIFLHPGDSIQKTISKHCPENFNVGSKFVFDPYLGSVIPKEHIQAVLDLFEPDVKIVHITRSYFDIFISFFARGGVAVRNGSKDINIDSVLGRNAKDDESSVEQRKIEFNQQQSLLIMLNMMHNDMICLELCRKAEEYATIDYSLINTDFCKIAEFVGSNENEETVRAIIDKPFLKKLSPINLDLVPHREFCTTVSQILNDVLAEEINLLNDGKSSGNPVTFFIDNNEIKVHISSDLTNRLKEHHILR